MELIKDLKHDESLDCQIGTVHSDLFDKDIEIMIEDGVSMEYAELCVSHFNSLNKNIVVKLCDRLYQYYQFMLNECGEDDINQSLAEFIKYEVPGNVTPQTILKYVSIQTIVIDKPKKNVAAYSISGDCAWEIEHGVEIIIHSDKILYVGEFTGIGPWRDEKAYICVF